MDSINNIASILKFYTSDLDDRLNNYSDFKGLEIELLVKGGFVYKSSERKLNFVDSLRSHLNSENIYDEDYAIKFWIINKWGGISSFKDNYEKSINSNRQKIDDFLYRIKHRKTLTKSLFEVISSLSKVASFSDSSKFFVYDSRVIYTLNWLLLKHDIKEFKFFPMPQGRNAKLSFFDLNTIIKLKMKKEYQNLDISDLYFRHENAYYAYCDLIKGLAEVLIPDRPAYHLEMLLFTLVDTIYDELRQTVNITID